MIAIRDLDFAYQGNEFRLHVPALAVHENERVAIVGPSGCGKTTLLNLLSGILVPSAGTIVVQDIDIAALEYEDRQDFRAVRMGLVFQEFELLEYLNVLENILLPFRINEMLQLNSEIIDRARALAGDVGLENKLHRYPGHLSQGERQRVAVCRGLIARPSIIFGDEPTGNLDPRNRDQVMDILFNYASSTRAPLVVVTHDAELQTRFDRTIDIQEFSV